MAVYTSHQINFILNNYKVHRAILIIGENTLVVLKFATSLVSDSLGVYDMS